MRKFSLCLLAVGLVGAVQAQELSPKLRPSMVTPRMAQPAASSQTMTPDPNFALKETVNDLVGRVAQLEQQLQATQQKLQATQQQLQQSQTQLSALHAQFAGHTHSYERTSIGFTNVHVDGAWASFINKNTAVPQQTSKPEP